MSTQKPQVLLPVLLTFGHRHPKLFNNQSNKAKKVVVGVTLSFFPKVYKSEIQPLAHPVATGKAQCSLAGRQVET